ncbi:hypothetical protein F4778DRAFT_722887 [Xylariomycetidae sp. FL2044]|nr:hypothetical protein F4778DRAFT_722887 [Xylariomycetidae sp. FL2044]
MLLSRIRVAPAIKIIPGSYRGISTLKTNRHIHIFPNNEANDIILTYLDTNPPTPRLAIGYTTNLPPRPQSFTENREFLSILTDVLSKNAAHDPDLKAQAQAFAGPGGATLGFGGGGGGGASAQGGAGGAGVGGHVHLSDLRNPPDFGRIAFPEDILGSIEVDGHGNIVGDFQPSGTYRILTREGILGLSDFLRTKLVERLREEERKG